MLKDNVPFKDLGSNYYTKFNTDKKANYYLKKLQELGVSVPVSLATAYVIQIIYNIVRVFKTTLSLMYPSLG